VPKPTIVPEDTLQKVSLYTNAVTTILLAIIWGFVWCFVAYMVLRCCEALAGKQTQAEVFLHLLASITLSSKIAWLTGGGGMAYGYCQSRFRKSEVARLTDRNSELERIVDPNRTSSGLTRHGKTKGTKIQ
jgi:hypothetical protein